MVEKKARKKRNRATALVLRDGRLLLVRERGAKHWSLPGGGMKKGEDPLAAAIRELDEETKLSPRPPPTCSTTKAPASTTTFATWRRKAEVELLKEEIGDYRWWDGETQLAIIPSAKEIIERAREKGQLYSV